MELTIVGMLTLVDILFLIYFSRKSSTIFPLLSISTLVYTISYVVPYYLKFDETSYDIGIFDTGYSFSAIIYFYCFKYVMNTVYYFKFRSRVDAINSDKGSFSAYKYDFDYKYAFYLMLVAFFIMLLSINNLEQIISPVDRFFSDNPTVTNLALLLLYALFIVFYVFYANSENKNRFLLILALAMCLFYPVLISSRSVVLPFLIMASVQLIVNKNYSMAFLHLTISVIFYITALLTRGELGIGNFITNMTSAVTLGGDFFDIFILSISGLMTLTATLSGLNSGSVDANPDILLFLLYISPVPSFLLPARIFEYTSLSQYLGIDPDVLGINVDVISESILWMSWYGPLCTGGILGYIFSTIDFASKNRSSNIIVTSILFISSLYFIVLSSIASMRAASRLLVYSYLLFLAYNYVRNRKMPA